MSEETLLSIIDKIWVHCAARAEGEAWTWIRYMAAVWWDIGSTRMNHRTDKFGGSLENRTRLRSCWCRRSNGRCQRMVVTTNLPSAPERGKRRRGCGRRSEICPLAGGSRRGYASCSAGQSYGQYSGYHPPMGVQPYGFTDIAGQVKEAVSIPVSTVGRIIDPLWQSGS